MMAHEPINELISGFFAPFNIHQAALCCLPLKLPVAATIGVYRANYSKEHVGFDLNGYIAEA